MIQITTNPIVEAAEVARSASERAKETYDPSQIDEAICEWEKVIQLISDDDILEDQADILASYANSLFLRWELNLKLDDIRAVVSNLQCAVKKLPMSSTKAHHDLLARLGSVHESWYRNFKDESQALIHAIRYWEEAYGLAVVLHQMKEDV
jgi:hypothetical protein